MSEGTIPYGYCQCGCGERTAINDCSNARRGWVKGEPRRFIQGHSLPSPPRGAANPNWRGGRTHSSGYVRVKLPGHPRANQNGYVYEHILVAEAALGRPLPEGAQVHHFNEDRADNRGANLVICPDAAYHALLHQRLRALRACGNPNWRSCRICGVFDDPANLYITATNCVHRTCVSIRSLRQKPPRTCRKCRQPLDAVAKCAGSNDCSACAWEDGRLTEILCTA